MLRSKGKIQIQKKPEQRPEDGLLKLNVSTLKNFTCKTNSKMQTDEAVWKRELTVGNDTATALNSLKEIVMEKGQQLPKNPAPKVI